METKLLSDHYKLPFNLTDGVLPIVSMVVFLVLMELLPSSLSNVLILVL